MAYEDYGSEDASSSKFGMMQDAACVRDQRIMEGLRLDMTASGELQPSAGRT